MSEETEEKTVEDYINEGLGIQTIKETKPAEEQEAAATSDDGEDTSAEESEETEAETEDEAESEDQEASAEDDDPEDKPKPRKRNRSKRDPEKRIRRVVAERNEERDKRLQAEAALEALRQVTQQPQPAAEKPQEPQAPRQEDFTDYAEYIEALSAHASQEAVKAALAEAQKQAQQTQQQNAAAERENELTTKAKALFAKGTEQFDDFEEVAAAEDLPVTEAMTYAMLESEIGHQIQYHLGTNPEEAQRISQLNPVQQVREMALLEASLQKPKRAKRKTTNAPEPIKPVGGKSGTKPQLDPDEMSIDEYMAHHRERVMSGEI